MTSEKFMSLGKSLENKRGELFDRIKDLKNKNQNKSPEFGKLLKEYTWLSKVLLEYGECLEEMCNDPDFLQDMCNETSTD